MKPKDMDQKVGRAPMARRRYWRGAALLAVFVALGLSLAACGGGSPKASSSTSDSGSSGSNSSANATLNDALRFASCMRSHGVANYQDPTQSGNGPVTGNLGGVNTNSSAYQSAEQACEKYAPAGNAPSSPGGGGETKLLKYAECMRSHGVSSFPDPTNGELAIPPGLDPQGATYQAAAKACQSLE